MEKIAVLDPVLAANYIKEGTLDLCRGTFIYCWREGLENWISLVELFTIFNNHNDNDDDELCMPPPIPTFVVQQFLRVFLLITILSIIVITLFTFYRAGSAINNKQNEQVTNEQVKIDGETGEYFFTLLKLSEQLEKI
ncbi:MAG: hypothetical protein HQK53_20220, partial [Oligoflexia bacterium]|nr:hypothetical protein [Oligoflexia bacterium]